MELFEKSDKLSAFVKASLGLLITAMCDSLASFSTAYWATWTSNETKQHGGYGLWKLWRCHLEIENDNAGSREMSIKGLTLSEDFMKEQLGCHIKMADSSFPAWYVASQVLQTVGLAALLTSLILVLILFFIPHWRTSPKFIAAIIGVSYFSGGCTTVSLFVFGFKVAEEVQESKPDDWALSWSFSLSCISCLLTQIAASVMVTERTRLKSSSRSPAAGARSDEDILPVVLPEHDKLLDQYPYDIRQHTGNVPATSIRNM